MSEIAHAGMMTGVRSLPVIMRRQRQDADDAPDPIVQLSLVKEGAMTAIVLNHEEAHQEPRRRDRKDQAKHGTDLEGRPHQRPQGKEWNDRDGKLHRASRGIRLAVKGEKSGPLTHIGGQRQRRRCIRNHIKSM
jgi:hypothetical protein